MFAFVATICRLCWAHTYVRTNLHVRTYVFCCQSNLRLHPRECLRTCARACARACVRMHVLTCVRPAHALACTDARTDHTCARSAYVRMQQGKHLTLLASAHLRKCPHVRAWEPTRAHRFACSHTHVCVAVKKAGARMPSAGPSLCKQRGCCCEAQGACRGTRVQACLQV